MRNKVAESIFELQYIVAKWKSGKSGIFHKADDFDFLMSRGDPYYQFYKNAPDEDDYDVENFHDDYADYDSDGWP